MNQWKMRNVGCLAGMFLIACGGEAIDFRSDQTGGVSGTGAVTSGTGAGRSVGTGAASGVGGASGYRPAGYAGAQFIVGPTGDRYDAIDRVQACQMEGGYSHSEYAFDACVSVSLCAPPCTTASECPTVPGGPSPECGLEPQGGPGTRSCILPCGADSDCPGGMRCGTATDVGAGKSCMFEDVRWAPHCASYCASTDETCADDIPCCEGTVCTPWQTCEARECLEFAFKCGEGLPDCCDGLTCRDGYCQTN